MSPDTCNPRKAWLIAALVGAALYLSTAAPGLLWGDSGDAQLRVLVGQFYDRQHLSRSHILYYAIVTAVTWLGISAAYAATLVSAVCGALTVANICGVIALLKCRRVAVFCGGTLLLCSHSLWHLSTVAEVMTLSTALLSLELMCVVKSILDRDDRWLIAALLCHGLGLSTHNMSLLIWPAYVALYFVRRRSGIPTQWSIILKCGLAVWLGAVPVIGLFVYLVARSGDPGGVVVEMLMGRYTSHVFNVSRLARLLLRMVAYTAYSFPSPLLVGAVVGLVATLRHTVRELAAFLPMAMGVYVVFAIRYAVPDQHVFMLHSYLFMAVFVGVGVDRCCRRCAARWLRMALMVFAAAGPMVYAIVPTVVKTHYPGVLASFLPTRDIEYRDNVDWFLRPWHVGCDGPERFARETLTALPDHAVLMIDSTPMPPLLYVQNAESWRRDVQILAAERFQAWFVAPIDMTSSQRDAIIRQGRLFTITRDRKYWNESVRGAGYTCARVGMLYRVDWADGIGSH